MVAKLDPLNPKIQSYVYIVSNSTDVPTNSIDRKISSLSAIQEIAQDPLSSTRVLKVQTLGKPFEHIADDCTDLCKGESPACKDKISIAAVITNGGGGGDNLLGDIQHLFNKSEGRCYVNLHTFAINTTEGQNSDGLKYLETAGPIYANEQGYQRGVCDITKAMTYSSEVCEIDIISYDCMWLNQECHKVIKQWDIRTPEAYRHKLECPTNTTLQNYLSASPRAHYIHCDFHECTSDEVYSQCSNTLKKHKPTMEEICANPTVIFVCDKYLENQLKLRNKCDQNMENPLKLSEKMYVNESIRQYCDRILDR